ncbi:MAG: dihydrolipoamide acetyltransferase family protein [Phycisphaerales bacterium]
MAHPGKSTDPNVFILPDLGEGVHEGELLKWRVKEGQHVNELDVLADMETDKAVVEVPSPRAGTIKTLHGTEGEILKVGNPLVTYVGGGGGGGGGEHQNGSRPTETVARNTAAGTAASTPRNVMDDIPEPTERTEDAGTVVGKVGGATPGLSAEQGKALATPAVRRLARDLGVDIDRIAGTGIGGRVLEKDVRAASGGSQPTRSSAPAAKSSHTPAVYVEPAPMQARQSYTPPAAPAASSSARRADVPDAAETTRIPFRGVRRTIANRLRESINQAVHFTVMDEADVSALDSLRRKLAAASGEKVSFLPFVCSAVARVLGNSQFRPLNATVDEKPGDANYDASIIQHRSVHLGIATDTESGLMVPVIRDTDRMGVLEIGRAVEQIATSARNRSIPREQLMGSTFTISNVGSYAGRFATPVINYPEVGILAVGRAREGVVVNKGAMRVGLLMPLSLACDHRVVDGATAALALAEIVKLLQDPEQLMGPARA